VAHSCSSTANNNKCASFQEKSPSVHKTQLNLPWVSAAVVVYNSRESFDVRGRKTFMKSAQGILFSEDGENSFHARGQRGHKTKCEIKNELLSPNKEYKSLSGAAAAVNSLVELLSYFMRGILCDHNTHLLFSARTPAALKPFNFILFEIKRMERE
jgi:hypothetical protein